MEDLIISLEATGDLTPSLIKQYNLKIVDMNFMVDGQEYSTEKDTVVSSGLYEKMRSGKKTMTSQVNVLTYTNFFKKLLKKNKPILHIAFSSGLSNTYESALHAANELNKEIGKKQIFVIDSLCACSGHGMLAILSRKFAENANSIEEVVEYVEKTKNQLNHSFTVDSLKYLASGGRIKPSAAFIGTIMNIKPVMRMDETGHLTVVSKVLSRKKSLLALYNKFHETHNPCCDLVFISHADCFEDAKLVASFIENNDHIQPIITNLGPVIGCHSGPGTMSVYYLADHR